MSGEYKLALEQQLEHAEKKLQEKKEYLSEEQGLWLRIYIHELKSQVDNLRQIAPMDILLSQWKVIDFSYEEYTKRVEDEANLLPNPANTQQDSLSLRQQQEQIEYYKSLHESIEKYVYKLDYTTPHSRSIKERATELARCVYKALEFLLDKQKPVPHDLQEAIQIYLSCQELKELSYKYLLKEVSSIKKSDSEDIKILKEQVKIEIEMGLLSVGSTGFHEGIRERVERGMQMLKKHEERLNAAKQNKELKKRAGRKEEQRDELNAKVDPTRSRSTTDTTQQSEYAVLHKEVDAALARNKDASQNVINYDLQLILESLKNDIQIVEQGDITSAKGLAKVKKSIESYIQIWHNFQKMQQRKEFDQEPKREYDKGREEREKPSTPPPYKAVEPQSDYDTSSSTYYQYSSEDEERGYLSSDDNPPTQPATNNTADKKEILTKTLNGIENKVKTVQKELNELADKYAVFGLELPDEFYQEMKTLQLKIQKLNQKYDIIKAQFDEIGSTSKSERLKHLREKQANAADTAKQSSSTAVKKRVSGNVVEEAAPVSKDSTNMRPTKT